MDSTPASLLERLRQPDDQAAWSRFVELYTPLLFHWARRLGLQQPDAADLVQEVLTTLVATLPRFLYRPSQRFRGWLWTVTVNKWRESRRRAAARPQEVGVADLDGPSVPDGVEALAESEYQDYLVARALQLMQRDFQPETWRAFWEYVVQERPAAEVAAELGVRVNAVHLAKSRILCRLRQELEGLFD
jgi:RNA polymerase sigma-70 factor (ECF subfamily)